REFVRQEIGDRHAYQWALHVPTAAEVAQAAAELRRAVPDTGAEIIHLEAERQRREQAQREARERAEREKAQQER
ncbi:TPA: DUF2637 domain-containing protein, partial [Escherichia coli]|nr:DUF2637 domain-containing protein [Escherichia coli]